MRYLRWLLAYFVGLAALPLVPFLVMVLDTVIGSRICPAGQWVSDSCMVEWYAWAQMAFACLGFGLGAALVVALPTLIAPSEKSSVAKFMFWFGTVIAVLLSLLTGISLAIPSLVAVTVGRLTWRRFSAHAGAESKPLPAA